MKKFLLILFVLTSFNAYAQEKKWEHNVSAGIGAFFSKAGKESRNGVAFKLGYGLNYYFSEHWSVMSGVSYREVIEKAFESTNDGVNDDHFTFIDVPIIAQYHIGNGNGSWTFGLGPVFSFCVGNTSYYINADPSDPRNKLDKCKSFSLALQPSVAYQFAKHWKVGLEGHLNLTDMKNKDDIYLNGRRHIHHVAATIGFVF